jgi:hypothetical protein
LNQKVSKKLRMISIENVTEYDNYVEYLVESWKNLPYLDTFAIILIVCIWILMMLCFSHQDKLLYYIIENDTNISNTQQRIEKMEIDLRESEERLKETLRVLQNSQQRLFRFLNSFRNFSTSNESSDNERINLRNSI